MKNVDVDIRPGSMITDRVANDMGEGFFQGVVNLRQVEKGLWENTPGYVNLLTGLYYDDGGTVYITATIDIAEVLLEDVSGDRFILFQAGLNLYRKDYPYTTNIVLKLDFPSGVSISGYSDKVRFFSNNGIIRISGTTEPLHYSYIQRRLVKDGAVVFTADWYLTKASLDNLITPYTLTNNDEDFEDTGTAAAGDRHRIAGVRRQVAEVIHALLVRRTVAVVITAARDRC